jgi:hypothetical protein
VDHDGEGHGLPVGHLLGLASRQILLVEGEPQQLVAQRLLQRLAGWRSAR